MEKLKPPEAFGPRGRTFWEKVHADLELEPHETQLLVEVCRVLDRLDLLNRAVLASPLITDDGRVNPLLIEARLQAVTLARLVASLRLPDEYRAEVVLNRPQRRGAARGPYRLKAVN